MRFNWRRIEEGEYRANLSGLNTFFGAVLGIVLADVSTPSLGAFAYLLFAIAVTVVSILYISASPQRWQYAFATLVIVASLPLILGNSAQEIGRLQVTLGLWTAMTILFELHWTLQQWLDRRNAAKDT